MKYFQGKPAVNCRRAFRSSATASLFHSSASRFHSTTLRAATIAFAFAVLCVFTGCNKKPAGRENASAQELLLQQNDESQIVSDTASASAVDFDLTKMGANMVYAQVFNMMIAPEEFAGKKIKMKGSLEVFGSEATGSKTYSVIVADALACCKTGIEFHYDFGGAEPPRETEITVTGIFTCTELSEGIAYNYVQAQEVLLN